MSVKSGSSGYALMWLVLTWQVKPKGLEAEWMEEGDLVVNFSLPAGSFATVMLREVMGGDDFLAEEEAPQEGEAEGEAADPPEGD